MVVEGSGESEGEASAEYIGETFFRRAFIFVLHVCSRERTRRRDKMDILEMGARLVGHSEVKKVKHNKRGSHTQKYHLELWQIPPSLTRWDSLHPAREEL